MKPSKHFITRHYCICNFAQGNFIQLDTDRRRNSGSSEATPVQCLKFCPTQSKKESLTHSFWGVLRANQGISKEAMWCGRHSHTKSVYKNISVSKIPGKREDSSCLMLGLAVLPSLHLLGPASNWAFMQWGCQDVCTASSLLCISDGAHLVDCCCSI